MIIYNVTVSVQTDTAPEWEAWMKEEHMADLKATGCFTHCRLHRLLEQDETEHITYVAQYEAPGPEAYQKYLDDYAGEMRARGLKKFGNRFTAFRTVMEQIA